MTISTILNLIPHLNKLDSFVGLPAKLRWNLARNIKTCAEVAKDFEAQRIAIVKRLAPESGEIAAGTPEHETAVKEIQELLDVESQVTLLKFQAADLVRDDIAVPASLLAALDELIEGEP